MLTFIKVLKYEVPEPKEKNFDYYRKLGLQQIDPPTLEPGKLSIPSGVVFHSTLRRAVECLTPNHGAVYVPTTSLNEIRFDLETMGSREEWKKYGSFLVRKKFKEQLIDDKLPEKRSVVLYDVKSVLLQYLNDYPERDAFFISHSFRMKIFEAFIRTKGQLEFSPEMINDYVGDDVNTYKFGGGFCVARKDIGFLDEKSTR